MVDLPADVEQTLRDLPDSEWSALQARVRPPDTAEQVRTAAARHVPADMLDSVMGYVDAAKFVDNSGQVDHAKIDEHFGRLFGANDPQQRPHWGQGSGSGGPPAPGDQARAALEKRHGIKRPDTPAAGDQIRPGESAREALAKRHPKGRR